MNWLFLLNMFSGPVGQLLTTGLTVASGAFVAWQVSKGVPADAASNIAGGLFSSIGVAINVLTGTQIAKIQSVNSTANGVRVVDTEQAKRASIPPINVPLK